MNALAKKPVLLIGLVAALFYVGVGKPMEGAAHPGGGGVQVCYTSTACGSGEPGGVGVSFCTTSYHYHWPPPPPPPTNPDEEVEEEELCTGVPDPATGIWCE